MPTLGRRGAQGGAALSPSLPLSPSLSLFLSLSLSPSLSLPPLRCRRVRTPSQLLAWRRRARLACVDNYAGTCVASTPGDKALVPPGDGRLVGAEDEAEGLRPGVEGGGEGLGEGYGREMCRGVGRARGRWKGTALVLPQYPNPALVGEKESLAGRDGCRGERERHLVRGHHLADVVDAHDRPLHRLAAALVGHIPAGGRSEQMFVSCCRRRLGASLRPPALVQPAAGGGRENESSRRGLARTSHSSRRPSPQLAALALQPPQPARRRQRRRLPRWRHARRRAGLEACPSSRAQVSCRRFRQPVGRRRLQ